MKVALTYNRNPYKVVDSIPIFVDLDTNPDLKSQYEKYIENYNLISQDHITQFEDTGNHFIPDSIWNELEVGTVSLINKYSAKQEKILDVGVGLGRLMSMIDGKDLDKHGIDISLNYLRYASEKNIKVSMSLAENLPYDDKVFDMIVCTDVLEHVLDINLALTEMLRCLKDGGILIIRVPYKEDLGKYLQPSCKYDYVHLRNFDEHNLYSMLSKVFGLFVLEHSLVGRNTEYCRFKLFLSDRSFLAKIGKAVYYYCKILEKFFNKDIKHHFSEYEINVVAQKPK
jgi:2-polyprenyl-3-methyl-5-hydroxy-6-metoxy-1,4-benzoquinol methylase